MAIRDVKEYFYTMQNQYLEMKQDLVDYEQAFKDGYVTEDQLSALKDDIAAIETNYQRLVYIMHLIELPNKKAKKKRVAGANKKILDKLASDGDDAAGVELENVSALNHFREELKKLTDK